MTRFDEKTTSAGAIFFKSFKEFDVDESRSTVDGGDAGDSDPLLIPSYYHIRPLDENWRFGAFYVSPAVDDEDRTFSFALDRLIGIGVGMNTKLASGNSYDLNFNLIDTGKAPIDTGDDPVRGRVVGEGENHYAIAIDFAFHWY